MVFSWYFSNTYTTDQLVKFCAKKVDLKKIGFGLIRKFGALALALKYTRFQLFEPEFDFYFKIYNSRIKKKLIKLLQVS